MRAFQDSRQIEGDRHDTQVQALNGIRQNAEVFHDEQMQAFEQARQTAENEHNRQMQLEEQKQCRRVYEWLRAPNVDIEHENLLKIRREYPTTGDWLLQHKSFKDWFDPDFAKIPPLLWLKGIPGSGTKDSTRLFRSTQGLLTNS